jgi:hypothetical protein
MTSITISNQIANFFSPKKQIHSQKSFYMNRIFFQIESLAMSKTSLAKNSQMLRPLSRKDIFYSGSVANLPEFRMSQKSLTTYRQSVISLPKLKAGSEMDGPVPMEEDRGNYLK